jgi:hypothetical protein
MKIYVHKTNIYVDCSLLVIVRIANNHQWETKLCIFIQWSTTQKLKGIKFWCLQEYGWISCCVKEKLHEGWTTVWFPFYEVEEWARLIYGINVWGQKSEQEFSVDREWGRTERDTGTTWGSNNVLYLDLTLVTWVCYPFVQNASNYHEYLGMLLYVIMPQYKGYETNA